MIRWCTGCSGPLPDDARFCPACGRAIATADGPTVLDDAIGIEFSQELRHITVVFCDLVGSTDLSSSMDAEEYGELIEGYQQRAVAIARAFGGDVEGYSGDGILFRFGWPQAHDDDAIHALTAALDIVQAVSGPVDGPASGHPGGGPQRSGRRRAARGGRPSGHHVGGGDAQRGRPAPGRRRAGHGGGQRGHHRSGRGKVRGGAARSTASYGASPSRSMPSGSLGRTGARSRIEVIRRPTESNWSDESRELATLQGALGTGPGRATAPPS